MKLLLYKGLNKAIYPNGPQFYAKIENPWQNTYTLTRDGKTGLTCEIDSLNLLKI